MADTITAVDVATIKSPPPTTIQFRPWVTEHREFASCRPRTEAGLEGFGFVYTRGGPIAAIVRRNRTAPFEEELGGRIFNVRWTAEQIVEDEDGLTADLNRREEMET
jgi:L-alanine-DL-glutamate epimerase-like enolase superfamily enzyme